ncbi:50S ribosomal protein L35 [Candidatus Roizmanbacteria bacterium CG10_big_fil_rev_8_21_14_0_10_39_6]|uniref:Large ribosomal subunit protein bL35 n=1 Tax=Candidatus Roizmanbacteria bacterium CG10_big_fil_rev_8_21_14_0_10_39_6 TaxID=1974853 RepID=A0A2M8KTI7_9BACT|nr:MAG: 50S ribosomal protein L35 [Candidatus Roizmanbacteria bacterium CG10_big_fil_rev_8_21_14_0_10_39_6]
MKKPKVIKLRKLKIKKSVSKRFKVTPTGKVMHRSQNIRHLSSNKSKNQLRRLRKKKSLFSTDAIKIKKLLGVG